MQNYQKNQKNRSIRKGIIGLGIVLTVFVVVYLATISLLTAVYGFDFENSTAYNQVMNATKDAANYTEGLMFDRYVQNVSAQIQGGI